MKGEELMERLVETADTLNSMWEVDVPQGVAEAMGIIASWADHRKKSWYQEEVKRKRALKNAPAPNAPLPQGEGPEKPI